MTTHRIETRSIHGGPRSATGAVAPPIHLSTTFERDEQGKLRSEFLYSRSGNPDRSALEAVLADLEGGAACCSFASGLAALHALFLTLEPGDLVLAPGDAYHGTTHLLRGPLARWGLRTRFTDFLDPEDRGKAFASRPALALLETPSNPLLRISPIARVAEEAQAAGALLVVDNTWMTPILQRPLEHGADIVVQSATKYIGGHGNSIGGVIVDSGNFPWAENKERFPLLNEPDISYHGVVYTEAFGPAAFIGRCRVVPLRNMGAALSPMNAFLLLQGMETLPLRMERICENSARIAEFLENHDQVEWVNYAGLSSHKDNALAEKYMNGRASGILSFGLKASREGTRRFYDALNVFLRLVNNGDCKSLASIPAETTHRQLTDEDLKALRLPSERTLDIVQFVKASEINPLYYHGSFYLAPSNPVAACPFHTVLDALRATGRVAVAQVVLGGKERVVAIRPDDAVFLMSYLHYADEVRPVSDIEDLAPRAEPKAAERLMAEQLLESFSGEFDVSAFEDKYRSRFLEIVETRARG